MFGLMYAQRYYQGKELMDYQLRELKESIPCVTMELDDWVLILLEGFDSVVDHGDLMHVLDMRERVDEHQLVDNDGTGDLIAGGEVITGSWFAPSTFEEMFKAHPEATHVVWYNK